MFSHAIKTKISTSSPELFKQSCAHETLLHMIRALYHQGSHRDVALLIHKYKIKGLESLMATLPKIYDFKNYERWLDQVEDIDHREEIELWVRRVLRGSLSEVAFEEWVARLLAQK